MGQDECVAIIHNHEPTEDKTTFSQLGFQQFLMFSELQVWPSSYTRRRRIKTEEKAKVVAAAWGKDLIQFLAAL